MDNICHPIYERGKTEGSSSSLREAKEAKVLQRERLMSNKYIFRTLEGRGLRLGRQVSIPTTILSDTRENFSVEKRNIRESRFLEDERGM